MNKKVVIAILILVGLFFAFGGGLGFGFGRSGAEIRMLSPSTDVQIDGSGNTVIAITGDDNHAATASERQLAPENSRDWMTLPLFVVLLVVIAFMLRSYRQAETMELLK